MPPKEGHFAVKKMFMRDDKKVKQITSICY